jgi:hypothetical protein
MALMTLIGLALLVAGVGVIAVALRFIQRHVDKVSPKVL